jgi:hypothetical protein
MKASLVIGMTLIALGFVALPYFASPVRILMLAYVPHYVNLTIPIAGGLSLACGLAVLLVCRSRKP